MIPLENDEVSIATDQIPGYTETITPIKKPPAELLDPEFHVAVINSKAINSFESWIADCYDAVMMYYNAKSADDKRAASIRIGQASWEASESVVSIGRIINAIANNWHGGIKGNRRAFGWMDMPWDADVESAYVAKTVRHLVQADLALTLEDKVKHLAALWCNANILWRRCGDLFV